MSRNTHSLSAAALALAGVLTCPLTSSASEPVDAEQIARCVRDNRPAANTLETVEFTSTDRVGGVSVRRATIYSGRSADAYRVLYMQLIYPSDLRGSRFLIAERDGATRVFLSLAGSPQLKQIASAGQSSGLLGTDFSSEDLAQLYGLSRPGRSRRLEDGQSEDRPTYVIETRPLAQERSTYSAIVSHVDKDTCVVLRSQFYERPGQLRKVLVAPTSGLKRLGSGWIAHELTMRDLRDETETRLVVQRIETGERIRDLPIQVEAPAGDGSPGPQSE